VDSIRHVQRDSRNSDNDEIGIKVLKIGFRAYMM
jgi:hypothetical protein